MREHGCRRFDSVRGALEDDMELADAVAAMDMDAIRAAVEPVRYRYILGLQIEDNDVAAIITLTREIDRLRDAVGTQYYDGVGAGMAAATPSAADYDAMRARVAFLERANARLRTVVIP
jgi:hypothetical protein